MDSGCQRACKGGHMPVESKRIHESALPNVVDRIFPEKQADAEESKILLDGFPNRSARESQPVSAMRRREWTLTAKD